MNLTWSHAVLYVHNLDSMLNFYTNVLGFEVTDRGPMGEGAPDIVFLSQSPDEHHQIAMVPIREDSTTPSNSVNHLAFRAPAFSDVKDLHAQLDGMEGINVGPLSHGNTLSIYFNDPEQNGVEVFWDTPWHVAQPQGKPWDIAMDETQALAWVQENFGQEASFEPREDYYARRRAAFNE